MDKDISRSCAIILNSISDKENVEQEARLGYFNGPDFFPGVSKHYYDACYKVLNKWMFPNKHTSIAIYFENGLRAEQFDNGRIECIKKFKIANDIDMKDKNKYAMRISTSREQPVEYPALKREIQRFLKPKQVPKLFREGSIFRFKPNTQVRYNNQLHNVNKGFNQLTWRNANPTDLTSLFRIKKKIHMIKTVLNPDTVVKLISLAGMMNGKPTYIGQYTVEVHMANLVPICQLADVNPVPPYVPTAWRKKERMSFQLWEGMTIDLTKTTFSKTSIQHCFDGRGKVRYEIEADWDTINKNTSEFSKAVTSILWCV